jgi:hypothetical protein
MPNQKDSRFGSPLTDTFKVLETGRLTHALLSHLRRFRFAHSAPSPPRDTELSLTHVRFCRYRFCATVFAS